MCASPNLYMCVCIYIYPVQEYIAKLGKLASHCGGGKGVPVIRMMDRFAKNYGANKILGEEFVSAIVDLHISDVDPLTMIRVACVLTNLISEKVVDGVAKLILKSDIEKLRIVAHKAKVIEFNAELNKGHRLATNLFALGHISQDQSDELIGKLFTRSILHRFGKEKAGPELRRYKNQDEIQSAFVSECLEAVCIDGFQVDPEGKWMPLKITPEDERIFAAIAPVQLLTQEQLSDPKLIMKAKGFAVCSIAFERKFGSQAGLYELVAIAGSSIELVEIVTFGEPNIKVEVALEIFIATWCVFKGIIPFVVPDHYTHETIKQQLETARRNAFLAISQHEATNAENRTLQYVLHPSIVVASEKCAKGSLKLAPLTDLGKIRIERSESSVPVKVGGQMVYAYAPSKPADKTKLDAADVRFVPFWWVAEASDEASANMKFVSSTVDGVVFPVFQNTRVILPFEQLKYYKPKLKKAPVASDAKRIKITHAASGTDVD